MGVMGSEAQINVWLNERNLPVKTFLDVAKHIEPSPFFGRLLQLVIRKNNRMEDIVKTINLEDFNFNITEIEHMIGDFTDQAFTLEAWWETNSYYTFVTEERYGKWHTKMVEETHRMVFSILGTQYLFSGHPNDVHMIIELGREIYLSPSHQGELAELNILSVICQLSYLIEFGIYKMHLPCHDNYLEPGTFHLAYHKEADGFRKDLTLWTQYIWPQPTLFNQDIIEIVTACEEIEYMEISGGILVFHKNLVEGSLESFYTKIVEFLECF